MDDRTNNGDDRQTKPAAAEIQKPRPRRRVSLDLAQVRRRMLAEINDFRQEGETVETKNGIYVFKDKGAQVLAVAHLDSVPDHRQFVYRPAPGDRTRVYAAQCDDRLGAYIILDLLPRLGVKTDILLTEGEERGRSTAAHFKPPEGKKYHWMFSFDRRGTDVVLYQYGTPKIKALVEPYCHVDFGSYSDIADLESLGCTGLNWGTGYYDNHGRESHFVLEDTEMQVEKFLRFWDHFRNTPIPAELSYHRKRYTGYTGYYDNADYYGSGSHHYNWKHPKTTQPEDHPAGNTHVQRIEYVGWSKPGGHGLRPANRAEPYPLTICGRCDRIAYPVIKNGILRWECCDPACKTVYYMVEGKDRFTHLCPNCQIPMYWSGGDHYRCERCPQTWAYIASRKTYTRVWVYNHPAGTAPAGQLLLPGQKPGQPRRTGRKKAALQRNAKFWPTGETCVVCHGDVAFLDEDDDVGVWMCLTCETTYTRGKTAKEKVVCNWCGKAVLHAVTPADEISSSYAYYCLACAERVLATCDQCGNSTVNERDYYGPGILCDDCVNSGRVR